MGPNKVIVADKLKINQTSFFKKILFWGFLAKRVLKWSPNEVFQVLSKVSECNLSYFFKKLQQHEDLKLTQMILLRITLFWFFWAKKGINWTQNEVFQILWELSAQRLSGVLHVLTESSNNKIEVGITLKFFDRRAPKMSQKLGILGITKGQCIKPRWFSASSWNTLKAKNWTKWLFRKNIFLKFLDQAGPQMGMLSFVFFRIVFIFLLLFFVLGFSGWHHLN